MTRWILATAWAGCATTLLAQAPPAGPTPPAVAPAPAPVPAPAQAAPIDPVLWQHLVNWETVMKGATNFYCVGTKTQETLVGARKGKRSYKTDIMCQMPSKARMNVTALPAPGENGDPNDYAAYIATKSLVLEYDGNDKRLIETRLPPGSYKGMLLLDFLSGAITAKAAAERFDIKFLGEDPNHLHLELKPRTPEDLADFEKMTLVLFRNLPGQPAYLPRQVVISRNKGQEQELWDFPKPAINVNGIKESYFDPVAVDKKTWKHIVQYAAAPGEPGVKLPGLPLDLAIPGAAPAPGTKPVVPTPGTPPK